MSTAPLAATELAPIVIYRSVDRDGATYALEPRSVKRLREVFGPAVHVRSRVFIAHETRADYDHVQSAIAPQIVMLLTGLPDERLRPVGGVLFRDSETDRDLPLTAALRSGRVPRMSRISFEREGHVALIGLNRPEKRNAFDCTMLDELAQAYTDYEGDDDLRCAVIFAHGAHFTGGLDLAEVGPAVASGRTLHSTTHVDPFGLGPKRRTKPVVAALQGYCFTVGVELALACDVRLAADDARFSQLEIKRGIFPFGGATLRLPAIAGWGNAMRWLLTGDVFDAAEALRIGLVQEILPAEGLLLRARELAARIAAQAPLAVRATLASAAAAEAEGLEAEAARLLDRARALMTTEDAAEGMRSFVERRDGVFRGR
jgi:enoyl-CoA hydratase/carnithine racemase